MDAAASFRPLTGHSGKEAEFERLVISDAQAQEWLQLQLSAAYTVGSISKRLFRRPKLWLCTGLIKSGKGTYEVDYSSAKCLNTTVSDPTNTVPASASVRYETTPGSNRKHDISGDTVIAAQWMLLYCTNKQRKEAPSTPYIVKLTRKYAEDNVKGVDAVFGLVSTSSSEIDRAEARGIELFDVSDDGDDDDDDDEDFNTQEAEGREGQRKIGILEPMFPDKEAGRKELEEYQKFEEALQQLKQG